MPILKIARMGHPVLARPALLVADPAALEIQTLAASMLETMEDAFGVGLAAPQVHVGLRLFCYRVPEARAGEEPPVPNTVLINPVITPIGDERDVDWEGCLSIPGLRAAIPRWRHIRYDAFGLDGAPVAGEATGFHARVIQHECDHLDGILYPERIEDYRLFGFDEELARIQPAAGADA